MLKTSKRYFKTAHVEFEEESFIHSHIYMNYSINEKVAADFSANGASIV